MSVGAALLAGGMLRADAAFDATPLGALGFRAGAEAGRALLTTLAGAMIGVTGVTFSITVVALSLASQQLGPRLIRNFLRDRTTQVVLGTFLATFVYALVVLQAVQDPPAEVPRIAVTVGMGLGLASLAMLIYFVHHIAHGIQADSVIASVAAELNAQVDRLYPERMGEEPDDEDPRVTGPDLDGEAAVVRTREGGYLQAIDEDALFAAAVREDVVVRLVHRPGDFVLEGSPVLDVWPAERASPSLADHLRACLLFGPGRTAEQDVEFAIDQLVEVAVRALSSGINDPFTAMRCVDRLGSGLCRLATRRFPSPFRLDDAGRLRVVARRSDFAGLVNAAFDQIRQHAATHPAVTIRLLETIEIVAGCASGRGALVSPLRAQADRILEGARDAGLLGPDLADVERRHSDAVEALGRRNHHVGPAEPRKRSS